MPRNGRGYPAELRAKVALEALREEATMAELEAASYSGDRPDRPRGGCHCSRVASQLGVAVRRSLPAERLLRPGVPPPASAAACDQHAPAVAAPAPKSEGLPTILKAPFRVIVTSTGVRVG